MAQAEPQAHRRIAGIELGGTKIVAVLGHGTTIVERCVISTSTPGESFRQVNQAIRDWDARGRLEGIGIASFGPIRVSPDAADFGTILATPKPGWAGACLPDLIERDSACPLALDTDVTAAALAEHALGAAQGCANTIYITIGTGIGAGILVDGVPVHGMVHPEVGHIRTRRTADLDFAGVCPFHGDCSEGLISGPALEARLPSHPSKLASSDPAWRGVAADLAELLAQQILTFSPHRVLVGGGVTMRQPQLLDLARDLLPGLLAGYVADIDSQRLAQMIQLPALGHDAGPIGALVLAERAAAGPR